ncbi:HIT domain-containing protein [Agromyces sp. NPDC055520]
MTASRAEPTLFERIAAREIPASVVAETERVIAFRDIAPKAPVHVVVTPKSGEYRDVVELAAGDPGLLAELVDVARGVADELADGQFRLVFNTGAEAGQTIFHVHAHMLAGGLEEATLARE